MPVVRKVLSREEIQVGEAPASAAGMGTGQTTPELLSARCRLVDLLNAPQDRHSLSGRADPTRKSSTGYDKPLRVEDLAEIAGIGISTLHHHFRVLTARSPLHYQKQIRLRRRGRAC